MKPLFFTFNGDEELDYSVIWSAHPGWLAISTHGRDFARWCGLEIISPQTMERWIRMWALVYFLDELIDDQPVDRRQEAGELFRRLLEDPHLRISELPEWVRPDLIMLVALLRNAMQELGPESWNQWTATALTIRDLGTAKASQRRLRSYLHVLVQEARLTAQLAFVCIATHEQHQQLRYCRFEAAFTHLAVGGVIYDHAQDLYEDYANCLSKVPPNRHRSRIILVRGMFEVVGLLFYPRIAVNLFMVGLRPSPRQIMRYWLRTTHAMQQIQIEMLNSAQDST